MKVEAMGKPGTSRISGNTWKQEVKGMRKNYQDLAESGGKYREVAGNTRKLQDLAGTCRNWGWICDYRNCNYFCLMDPFIENPNLNREI